MTEINPDKPDKPIEVSASAVVDQTQTASRDVLLIVATLPALIAVLGKGDVKAVVDYIASNEFAPALSVIVGIGVIAWRQWLARKNHANNVKMASALPNRIAIVKGGKQ